VPIGAAIIDGHGTTLMTGLIDSHVHTDINGLHDALKFGVTTELEMQGRWTTKQRKEISSGTKLLCHNSVRGQDIVDHFFQCFELEWFSQIRDLITTYKCFDVGTHDIPGNKYNSIFHRWHFSYDQCV
jgi:hypothetical protein